MHLLRLLNQATVQGLLAARATLDTLLKIANNIGLKVFDYFEVEVSVKQTYSLQVKGVCDFRVV